MNNPVVSIIVPVYNVERYLAKCLDSIVNQSYTSTEIVIVNDGSPDDCHRIIKEYENKDRRIQVITKSNGGLASARNAGVAIATGEYIWHVDSDDYAEPDCLEKMVATACRENADIVVSGYRRINANQSTNDIEYVGPRFTNGITGATALCLMLCGKIGGEVWTKLYKRSLYTENGIIQHEAFSVIEDTLLNYQLYAAANIVVPLEYVSINHFYRENSYSSRSKTRDYLALSYKGLQYMNLYGFATKDIENAYYGALGRFFLRCYCERDRRLLEEIDAVSIRKIYRHLCNLSRFNSVNGGIDGTTTRKMEFFVKCMRYSSIRIVMAFLFKLLAVNFRKK